MADLGSSPEQIWKHLPPEQQKALHSTRAAIAKAVPGATQCIAWGMPGFRVGKDYLTCVTGFKKHNSLFPGGGVSTTLKKELKKFTVSKGTIHFDQDTPFPTPLLKKILKARIAEINASYPKASGEMREYYDNGFVKAEGKMKDGELHGAWKWFRRDGTLMRTGSFKRGAQIGEWTTYDNAGNVVKVTKIASN